MKWEEGQMRPCKTFFNRAVFRKTAFASWPVWCAYCLIWTYILPIRLFPQLKGNPDASKAGRIILMESVTRESVLMGISFGIVAAMSVWYFLYATRAINGIAALPIRREALFFSAVTAGLAPMLVVNLLVSLLCVCAGAGADGALQWFGLSSLIFFFFYGFATFCAQIVGNILALPAVYLILNYIFGFLPVMINRTLSCFVYGMPDMELTDRPYLYLMPERCLRAMLYTKPVFNKSAVSDYTFYGWNTVWSYSAAGAVFVLISLFLYRKRKMESAGDTLSIPLLKTVLCWIIAIFCGLFLSCLSVSTLPESNRIARFFLALCASLFGLIAGWLAAQMLINMDFRVFRKDWSGVCGCGVCCAALLCFFVLFWFDFFGYERYIPPDNQIKSVSIRGNEISEPANIRNVIAFHRSVIQNKDYHLQPCDKNDMSSVSCEIVYTLTNGLRVERYYTLRYPKHNPDGDALMLQRLINVPEAIVNRHLVTIPFTPDSVSSGQIHAKMTPDERGAAAGERFENARYTNDENAEYTEFVTTISAGEAWELYNSCIVPDMTEGKIGHDWILGDADYGGITYAVSIAIYAQLEDESENILDDWFHIQPEPESSRTNQWLSAHHIALHTVGEVQ